MGTAYRIQSSAGRIDLDAGKREAWRAAEGRTPLLGLAPGSASPQLPDTMITRGEVVPQDLSELQSERDFFPPDQFRYQSHQVNEDACETGVDGNGNTGFDPVSWSLHGPTGVSGQVGGQDQ